MAKVIALVLTIEFEFPHLFIAKDENEKIKTFTTESQAEIYINKTYTENCVLYGVVPDPTSIHKLLRKKKNGNKARPSRQQTTPKTPKKI